MSTLAKVHLKVARRSNHPWIFQKMVERPATRIPRNPSRCGGPGWPIRRPWVLQRPFPNCLRILTHREDEVIDEGWIRQRLQMARDLRESTLSLGELGNGYRLCHSEADGLSGLIIDKFDQMIVVEYFSAGWFRLRETVLLLLAEMYPGCQFYWFAEEHVQKQEAFDCHPIPLPQPIAITEHGLRFRVAPGSKHKTGFFLDQARKPPSIGHLLQRQNGP